MQSYKRPSKVYNTNVSGKENFHVKVPFGHSNYTGEDHMSQEVLHKKMFKSNTLTVCSSKSPEYYLKLIRYHFTKTGTNPGDQTLSIQALGLSCQNLVYVACLVTMKGYATYKRIKNDHLSVPIADSATGAHLGLVKKVRLTVKLHRAANFDEIVARENHQAEKQ